MLVLRPDTIKPSRVKPACYALLVFVGSQPFMYGQATDVDFMCRSITLMGGLLLLIWSENDRQRRSDMSTGLPQGVQGAGADSLQLCGRLALTFLFLFQVRFSYCPPPAPSRTAPDQSCQSDRARQPDRPNAGKPAPTPRPTPPKSTLAFYSAFQQQSSTPPRLLLWVSIAKSGSA